MVLFSSCISHTASAYFSPTELTRLCAPVPPLPSSIHTGTIRACPALIHTDFQGLCSDTDTAPRKVQMHSCPTVVFAKTQPAPWRNWDKQCPCKTQVEATSKALS